MKKIVDPNILMDPSNSVLQVPILKSTFIWKIFSKISGGQNDHLP